MQLTSTQDALPAIDGRATSLHATHEIAALTDFYRALNTGDLDLMAQVWWTTDEVSVVNPFGGVVRGWNDISAMYARMFRSMRFQLALCDYTIHIIGSVFYAVGRERGHIETSRQRLELEVHTTRVFRLEVSRWHQAHHHGSVDDPEMLQLYKRAMELDVEAVRH
jgi:ketosteroid isomerase-like protein